MHNYIIIIIIVITGKHYLNKETRKDYRGRAVKYGQ